MTRECLLYELGVGHPVAHIDAEGQVWKRGEGCGPDVLVTAGRLERGALPQILFAEVPVVLHLTIGLSVAPMDRASTGTGPPGLFEDAERRPR